MAGTAVSPIAYRQGEGEMFWSFGTLTTTKASAETGGRVTIIEQLATKGVGLPLHVHHNEDEWFYIIEGELTFWIGGRVITGPVGSFVFGPRDIPHTFTVSSRPAFLSAPNRAALRSFCANSPSPR